MSDYHDDDVQILIEFADSPATGAGSVGEVYRGGRQRQAEPADIEAKSRTALDNAMAAIKSMARRVVAVSNSLDVHEKPTQIEVEFALKLTSEAGVYVAKAGTEASFNVKLIWEGSKDKDAGQ